jgi:hypothetical protein
MLPHLQKASSKPYNTARAAGAKRFRSHYIKKTNYFVRYNMNFSDISQILGIIAMTFAFILAMYTFHRRKRGSPIDDYLGACWYMLSAIFIALLIF